MTPKALIIRTAGTNCDQELAHAFALAGAQPQTVHLNQLINDPSPVEHADLIGFPGGFSYGDDLAAGRIFADLLRRGLCDALIKAYHRRVPMIGICNGFQVLASLGFLPDPTNHTPPKQVLSLADNRSGRFIAKWINLRVNRDSSCVWTNGLDNQIELPIAHAEGRLVFPPDWPIETLIQQGQVVFTYDVNPSTGQSDNPNGSTRDIAGICDPTGMVLGLMPHPERYTTLTHHPQWTRRHNSPGNEQVPAGLAIFRSAVSYVRSKQAGQPVNDLVRS